MIPRFRKLRYYCYNYDKDLKCPRESHELQVRQEEGPTVAPGSGVYAGVCSWEEPGEGRVVSWLSP